MLSTARALVLDDNYLEVQPVIMALARLGIGSVYLSGAVDDMPEAPLHGIRLAIVDMDLTGADQSPEEKANHTLNVLANIILKDANPLMVIVWTGDNDTYEAFRLNFPVQFPHCAPGIVDRLAKDHFNLKDDAGVDGAAMAIRDTITEQLALARPLDLFWSWEQGVHDAASRTTSAIADIIEKGKPDEGTPDPGWQNRSAAVLAALARASSGQQGETPAKLLDDLCSGLEPLLLDRLEQHRVPAPDLVAESAQIIFDSVARQNETDAAWGEYRKDLAITGSTRTRLTAVDWDGVDFISSRKGPEADPGRRKSKVVNLIKDPAKPAAAQFSSDQAAHLNAMLHWSVIGADTQVPVRPGSIYLIGKPASDVGSVLEKLGFDEALLRKDTFASTTKGGPAVLVEATPACDYAQRKWTMPRFVAGFLAPKKDADGMRKGADFLRSYGPLWYAGGTEAGANVNLVLNSHFAPSVGMTEVQKWAPILILRRRTLTDLQVWLSAQHMRQGLLNVS